MVMQSIKTGSTAKLCTLALFWIGYSPFVVSHPALSCALLLTCHLFVPSVFPGLTSRKAGSLLAVLSGLRRRLRVESSESELGC